MKRQRGGPKEENALKTVLQTMFKRLLKRTGKKFRLQTSICRGHGESSLQEIEQGKPHFKDS